MTDTYICAACGDRLRLGDQAAAEAEATAMGFDPDECVVVCDDCFNALLDLHGEVVAGPTLN